MTYPTSSARTSYIGTEATGDVLTKANFDKSPGGMVAYAQITANGSALTGFTAVTGLGGNSPATANRMFVITIGAAGFALTGTGGQTTDFCIYSTTSSQSMTSAIVANDLSVSNQPGATCSAYTELTGNNFEAVLSVVNNSGTNQCAVLATAAGSAARTAWMIIQDVGPAF